MKHLLIEYWKSRVTARSVACSGGNIRATNHHGKQGQVELCIQELGM